VKRLSEARIESLALAIVDRVAKQPGVVVRDRGAAVRATAARLHQAFQVDAALDGAVRARIASLKRSVPEGSREWDVLYRQYLDELARRR
jgi:hypothetical protein